MRSFHQAGALIQFRDFFDQVMLARFLALRQTTIKPYKSENRQSSFTPSRFWASIARFTNGPGLDQAEK
jgi:hypothetical protein